jgi:hypothetical protein
MVCRVAAALAAAGAVLLSGCGYRAGSLMHPQIASMAVGSFENATPEPGLTGILRSRLAEHIVSDGSVLLADVDSADAEMTGTIRDVAFNRVASVKAREEDDAIEDADEYQTGIYRVKVLVEYEVRVPGYQNPLIGMQTVAGTADFSRMHDMQLSRNEAVRLALNDAARKMVAGTTEAW